MDQTEVGEPSNVKTEKNDDNNGGKRKDNGKNSGDRKNVGSKCFKGGVRYECYSDLIDSIENIYLATQRHLPYKKLPTR